MTHTTPSAAELMNSLARRLDYALLSPRNRADETMREVANSLRANASTLTKQDEHPTQDCYEHFLSYSGLEDAPLLRYAYFHGADVGIEKPTSPQPADGEWTVTEDDVNVALDGFNDSAATGELFLTSLRDKVRMQFAVRDAFNNMRANAKPTPTAPATDAVREEIRELADFFASGASWLPMQWLAKPDMTPDEMKAWIGESIDLTVADGAFTGTLNSIAELESERIIAYTGCGPKAGPNAQLLIAAAHLVMRNHALLAKFPPETKG